MPLPIQNFVLINPGGGGANEKLKGDGVRDNQSAPPSSGILPLKNCHTNTIGSIVKRSGYTQYAGALGTAGSPSTTMEEITGLIQYQQYGGNQYEIATGSSGGTIGLFDISTPASPVDITGSVSITDDTRMSFAFLNDLLLMTTDDRDGLFKWNGSGDFTAITGSPAPPSGKYLMEFENYAFIANTSTAQNFVYFSALADPESWLAVDRIRLNDTCTGLGKSGNDLFAFTEKSITLIRFTGDAIAPFNSEQLDTRIGTKSPHSIINVEGTLYWLGNDGHGYRMNGLTPQRITEVVPTTIGRVNKAVLSKCVAINHVELRQVWFAVCLDSATENDFVIAFDYLNDEIFFYDGMNINSLANLVDSTGSIKTYFGDRNGRVYLTNTGNSDYPSNVETAISMIRYTKQFHFDSPNLQKRIRTVEATVNNQGSAITTITTEGDFGSTAGETVSVDHDAGDTTIGDFIIGTDTLGAIDDQASTTDVCTSAKYVQLKIENAQSGVPVEIRDIAMRFQTYQSRSR